MTCESCESLKAQRDRMLRICQAARLFVEGGAAFYAPLVTAVKDAIARADSRPLEVQRQEADEMAARWRARAHRFAVECHVEQEQR